MFLLASFEPETFAMSGQSARVIGRPLGLGGVEEIAHALRRAQADVFNATEVPLPDGDDDLVQH